MPLVSLVIPARDEEETIGECIRQSMKVFDEMGIEGEVIVADSSEDSTPEIALSLGAKVIRPEKLGDGNAYLSGFKSINLPCQDHRNGYGSATGISAS